MSYGGYGGYTTGGFVGTTNSPSQAPGSQGAPGSASGKKSSTETTLRPLSIKQVSDAKETIPDQPLVLDGKHVHNVLILGRINNVSEQSTNVRYTVDDGTGIIDATKWVENKDDDSVKTPSFPIGMYVKVVGTVRIFGGKKSIQALFMKPVENMDEITYHHLNCIYSTLSMTTPLKSTFNMNPAMNGMNPGMNSGINSFGYVEKPINIKRYQGHDDQVLQMIRQAEDSNPMDGARLHDLVYKLRGEMSEMDVRSVVDKLMESSAIYTTVDDETFKCS